MVKFLLLPLLEVLNAFFLYKNLKFKISWLLKKFNSMGVLVHQSKVKYILGYNQITFYAFWKKKKSFLGGSVNFFFFHGKNIFSPQSQQKIKID